MSIQDIVNVQISRDTAIITRIGFGTPAILAKVGNVTFAELINFFFSLQEVQDSFDAGDIGQEELDAATRIFSQQITPEKMAIIKRATPVAQVSTVAIDSVVDETLYEIKINGVAFTFTSGIAATQTQIADGLVAAIVAGTEPVTPLNVADDVQITADNAGEGFTTAVNDPALMSVTTSVANVGARTDLAAASAVNDDFYGIMMISRTDGDIMDLAFGVEAVRKSFIACSDAAAIITAATTDIGSRLKAKSLSRTGLLFSTDQASFPDAAWLGRILPREVGSVTWALKTLVGIEAEGSTDARPPLTGAEKSFAKGKNVNFYVVAGGVSVTQGGNTASGEFLDVIRGVDFIQARMTENVFEVLVKNEKVPYTDQGITLIGSPINATLEDATTRGILASPDGILPAFTVNLPKALDIPSSQKQTRVLSGITFGGKLAGAVHDVDIIGNVSV